MLVVSAGVSNIHIDLPQAFLHLLLKISESITRLESLLLIASPADADNLGTDRLNAPSRVEDGPEDRCVEPPDADRLQGPDM